MNISFQPLDRLSYGRAQVCEACPILPILCPTAMAPSVRDGAAVPKVHIRDEWLLPTLETLLTKESAGILKSAAQESYWESAVRRGLHQRR